MRIRRQIPPSCQPEGPHIPHHAATTAGCCQLTRPPSTHPVLRRARKPAKSAVRSEPIRPQIAALASGAFLAEARNIVLLGPPGTGKTHLSIGLGINAARQGHRVAFATATDWVTRLTEAHQRGRLPAELGRLRRYGLGVDAVSAIIDRIVHHADRETKRLAQKGRNRIGRKMAIRKRPRPPTGRRMGQRRATTPTTMARRMPRGKQPLAPTRKPPYTMTERCAVRRVTGLPAPAPRPRRLPLRGARPQRLAVPRLCWRDD